MNDQQQAEQVERVDRDVASRIYALMCNGGVQEAYETAAKHRISSLRSVSAAEGVMRAGLLKCHERFREYEALHAAKPDLGKARRNGEMADMCEQALGYALASLPPSTEGAAMRDDAEREGDRERIAQIIYDNCGGAMMLLREQSLKAADIILAALAPAPTEQETRR